MIHNNNMLIVLVAVFFLLATGCTRNNSATMQELSRIDSMVYHQQEKEALLLLQQMPTDHMGKQERAYHAVLLTMAMYKNYIPCRSDSAINEAVGYYRHSGDDLKYLKALIARDIFGNQAFYPILNRNDKTIQEALKAMNKHKAAFPITE